eukprot:101413-Chlamydomonas_euryale.AAC.2
MPVHIPLWSSQGQLPLSATAASFQMPEPPIAVHCARKGIAPEPRALCLQRHSPRPLCGVPAKTPPVCIVAAAATSYALSPVQ